MSAAPAERVVVVGAGLSGLAAASALARVGLEVSVLDARSEAECRPAPEALSWLPAQAPRLSALAMQHAVRIERRRVAFECGAERTAWARELGAVLCAPAERLREWRLRRLVRRYAGWLAPGRPELGLRLDDRSAADFARLYLGRGPLAERLLGALELCFGVDPAEASRLSLLLLLDAWGELETAAVSGLLPLGEALAAGVKDLRYEVRLRGVEGRGRTLWMESGECVQVAAWILVPEALPAAGPVAELLHPARDAALTSGERLAALALRVRVRDPRSASPEPGAELRARLAPGLHGRPERALTGGFELSGGEWLLRARPGFARRARELPDAQSARRLLAEAAELWPKLFGGAEPFGIERWTVPAQRVGSFRAEAALAPALAERTPPLFAVGPGAGLHAEAQVAAGLRAADLCARRLRAARS